MPSRQRKRVHTRTMLLLFYSIMLGRYRCEQKINSVREESVLVFLSENNLGGVVSSPPLAQLIQVTAINIHSAGIKDFSKQQKKVTSSDVQSNQSNAQPTAFLTLLIRWDFKILMF